MKLNVSGFFKDAVRSPFNEKKPVRSYICKIIRILYLAVAGFFSKGCYLRSALLTFYSLISLVPILAIIFSIAKGFGLDAFLQKQILEMFQEQKEVFTFAMQFSYAVLSHIESQTVVGAGALFLFFTVFGLFENIEKALNDIWHVKKYRGLMRRFINYLTALVIFPIFFIFSMSATIFINAEIAKTTANYELFKAISPYIVMILKIAPYGLMFLLFCYIYIFTPNSKIYFKPRLIAGLIASVIFQLWQIVYIKFQVSISTYNIIFGSFAALPLFLIWMQINFVILMFGAEIAAQLEGDRFFRKKTDEDHFKTVSQKQMTILILHEITKNYLKGHGPLSIEQISKRLGISLLDARGALNVLENTKMIAEISTHGRLTEKYQLIVNPELFTLQSVSDLVEKNLSPKQTRIKATDSAAVVANCFKRLETASDVPGVNVSLKEFASLDRKSTL